MRFSCVIIFLFWIFAAFVSCFDDKSVSEREYGGVPYPYRHYDEAMDFLRSVNANYPNITKIEFIGLSARGRAIAALVISAGTIENKPRVRLTGSIHGNEYISSEILFWFIDYLTSEYGINPRMTELLDERYIAIIPILNPDGHELGRRYNANNVDLNRNFTFYRNSPRMSYHGKAAFDQPESRAIRDYSGRRFHLSAVFHSGEVVVNLPFDYSTSGSILPDENRLLWELGRIYADSGTMHIFKKNPHIYYRADEGVINGGDWYVIDGSLQDWSYMETGCIDITVEVARSSPSTQAGIEEVFLYNRDSLLAYIEAAGNGVWGKVVDEAENPLEGVSIKRAGVEDFVIYTNEDGYFMRLLEADFSPGTEFHFSKNGYAAKYVDVYKKGEVLVVLER
ncbi:MAG: DUF2817 domain-containing protein [Leptospirales bacterium]|nr:DUF2817 domain-containing protein [Leptospirales bacterium]